MALKLLTLHRHLKCSVCGRLARVVCQSSRKWAAWVDRSPKFKNRFKVRWFRSHFLWMPPGGNLYKKKWPSPTVDGTASWLRTVCDWQVDYSAVTGERNSSSSTRTVRSLGTKTRAGRWPTGLCCSKRRPNWWPSASTRNGFRSDPAACRVDAPSDKWWLSAPATVKRSTGSSPNQRRKSGTCHFTCARQFIFIFKWIGLSWMDQTFFKI